MKKSKILLIIILISCLSISYFCFGRLYSLDSDKYLQMYKLMIDEIMMKGIDFDSEYIALDLEGFKFINNEDKKELLEYVKKYHSNAIDASYEDLKIEGQLDLRGYLITISGAKKMWNSITLEIGRYKASLGALGYVYKATYLFNEWHLKTKVTWLS